MVVVVAVKLSNDGRELLSSFDLLTSANAISLCTQLQLLLLISPNASTLLLLSVKPLSHHTGMVL